jgi:hypothetical protein
VTASPRVSPFGLAAIVLHVLFGIFPYGFSTLLAPGVGVVVLALVWVALAVVAWQWRARRSAVPLLVPLVAVAAWFGVLSLGDALLGWSA